ncbi:copper amine oxidase N-terminal domain-containing protein [Desulforamulus hydrothermalis]|nr:copper amine oxidase N-terminal domain-containing protein [Desulforamulus hydrothermalis]
MVVDDVAYLPGSWVAFAFGSGTYWDGETETWAIYY